MLSSPDSRSPSPEIRQQVATAPVMSAEKSQQLAEVKRAGYGTIGGRAHYSDHAFKRHINGKSDLLELQTQDAVHLVADSKTHQRKIANASGATLAIKMEADRRLLTLEGTEMERARARDYIRIVLKQRTGKIELDLTRMRNDLSVISLPRQCVGYITGKQRFHLNRHEEEWNVLMFFPKVSFFFFLLQLDSWWWWLCDVVVVVLSLVLLSHACSISHFPLTTEQAYDID